MRLSLNIKIKFSINKVKVFQPVFSKFSQFPLFNFYGSLSNLKHFSTNTNLFIASTDSKSPEKIKIYKDIIVEKPSNNEDNEKQELKVNVEFLNSISIPEELKNLIYHKEKPELHLKSFIFKSLINSIRRNKTTEVLEILKCVIDKTHKYSTASKFSIEEMNLIMSEYIKSNKLNNNLLVITAIHEYIIANQILMNTVSLNYFINTYLEIKGFNSAYNLLVEASLLNIMVDYTSLIALYFNIFKITNFKVRTKCKYFIENYVLRNYGRFNKKLFEQIYTKKLKEIKNKKQDKKEPEEINKSQGRKKSEENTTKVINNWHYSLKQFNKNNTPENQQSLEKSKLKKINKKKHLKKTNEDGKILNNKENSILRKNINSNNKSSNFKSKQQKKPLIIISSSNDKKSEETKENKTKTKNESNEIDNKNVIKQVTNTTNTPITANLSNTGKTSNTESSNSNDNSVNKAKRFPKYFRKRQAKKEETIVNKKDKEEKTNNSNQTGDDSKPESR